MSFLDPELLWALVAVPVLLLIRVVVLRRRARRARRARRYSGLRLAAPARRHWIDGAPAALTGLALVALGLAVARPVTTMTLPSAQKTIVLAMDVSGSMRAKDVSPDRLTASQHAARNFVAGLPRDIRVGVVAYGGSAHVVQAPTKNREAVHEAIEKFRLQPGTAIGSGLMTALVTLLPRSGLDEERTAHGQRLPPDLPLGSVEGTEADNKYEPVLAPGSYAHGAIVLLSDGQNTVGMDPHEAATLASRRGVKVFTVGFGTPGGDVVTFGGWTIRVRLDEKTLRDVAEITHGEYFYAATGKDLERCYETLTSRLAMEPSETELTGLFSGFAALLLCVGAGLSVLRHGRIL